MSVSKIEEIVKGLGEGLDIKQKRRGSPPVSV